MPASVPIDSPSSLEKALHELIPITEKMGIRVIDYDGRTLQLSAPLTPNINHQQSGFGGSLFSIAAVAGWGILQLKLSELGLDCNTVIATGDLAYKRPVFSDYECRCTLPDEYDTFANTLIEVGKADLSLTCEVLTEGKVAMTTTGHYVVNQKRSGES